LDEIEWIGGGCKRRMNEDENEMSDKVDSIGLPNSQKVPTDGVFARFMYCQYVLTWILYG